MNIFLSAFIGMLIAIMILFNATLSITAGNYGSAVIIHAVGLICIWLVLIFKKQSLRSGQKLSIFLYSAGAIGMSTVLLNNISFITVGMSATLSLGPFGQSLASMVIDHFGLLEMKALRFNPKKLIGLAVIGIGIFIMQSY